MQGQAIQDGGRREGVRQAMAERSRGEVYEARAVIGYVIKRGDAYVSSVINATPLRWSALRDERIVWPSEVPLAEMRLIARQLGGKLVRLGKP